MADPDTTTETRAANREAAEYEKGIADEARAIWADDEGDSGLTERRWRMLYPLLCRPIPAAYIITTAAVKGKPYESTGIKSVQVQVDRMNNVLGPQNWWWKDEYEQDGKLCRATVHIDAAPGFWTRSSMGGVNQGSTIGNIYKGSFTNAMKRALALLGPGHEVYLFTGDMDPDTDPDVAAAQGGNDPVLIGKGPAKKLVDRAWEIPDAKRNLQLAAAHTTGKEIEDCSTKAKATEALAILTPSQAEAVDTWITRKAGGASSPMDQPAGTVE